MIPYEKIQQQKQREKRGGGSWSPWSWLTLVKKGQNGKKKHTRLWSEMNTSISAREKQKETKGRAFIRATRAQ